MQRSTPNSVRHKVKPKSGNKSVQPPRSRSGKWMTRQFRVDIQREARSLGLEPGQYMRLLVALSKALRKGLLKDKTVDAKALLQLAESPLFAAMIQYVADSASQWTKEDASEDPNDGSSKANTNSNSNSNAGVAPGAPGTQRPDASPPARLPNVAPQQPLHPGLPPSPGGGPQPQTHPESEWAGNPAWYWDVW